MNRGAEGGKREAEGGKSNGRVHRLDPLPPAAFRLTWLQR